MRYGHWHRAVIRNCGVINLGDTGNSKIGTFNVKVSLETLIMWPFHVRKAKDNDNKN